MKNLIIAVVSGILFIGSGFVWMSATSAEYTIIEGYNIAFKSKDPSGEFKKMQGKISFSEEDLEGSKFDLHFDVSSISTGNGMMNKKSQTTEWFDAAKYPKIHFLSTRIEKSGEGFIVYGNLKIKGITKEYKVPLKAEKNGKKVVFSGSFKVNRLEFKVGKKSESVPDYMQVSYSIPANQK